MCIRDSNAITGFAEVLGSATTEEEKAQYQEIIKMNADLLMQLVNLSLIHIFLH